MKKPLFFIITLIIISIQSYSQKSKDVLYLKNGSVIHGTLIELTNDQYKIQTSDGSLFIFTAGEVAKYLRSLGGSDESKKEWFGLSLEAGFLVGSQSSRYDHPFSFNLIADYNIDRKNTFGIGSGIEFIGQAFSPVFLEYRHLIFDRTTTPYFFFRGGALMHLGSDDVPGNGSPQYNVPGNYKGGVSLSVGTGITWVKENLTTYLSFAYRYLQTSYKETTYNTGDIIYKDYYNRLEIKLGFKF